MIESMSITSKELRGWQVEGLDTNSLTRDPTLLSVSVAFPVAGAAPSVWTAAAWATDMSSDPDSYYAEILLSGTGGGGTVTLATGVYDVWVKVVDGSASPTRHVSTLVVTS